MANNAPEREKKSKQNTNNTTNTAEDQSKEPPSAQTRSKEALKTILWADLPHWMKDNQYIHTGYRSPSNSYSSSAASLLQIHNETVNIWTHLLGSIIALTTGLALFLAFYDSSLSPSTFSSSVLQSSSSWPWRAGMLGSLRARYDLATEEDIAVFGCFFIGAAGCLGLSATYHTLSNHSEKVARLGNRLDYLGIVVLIWGSFVPSIFYGFAQEKGLRRGYWGMITTIGAGTLIVVLYPKFRTPEWRPVRAAMFVAMGLSAVFPVLHGIRLFGVAQLERQIGLSWLVLQGVLYILGAGIYAARVPERWRPGAFDIWGSSHQIFHVLVLLAAAAHFVGLLKAFDHEHSYRRVLMESYERARGLGDFSLY